MKKFSLKVLFITSIIVFTGCAIPSTPSSSNTHNAPTKISTKIDKNKQFQIYKIPLSVTQLIDSDKKYHSDKELELLINEKLIALLKKENYLTTKTDANIIMITVSYERRFVGDKTPIPSTSLSYPKFEYSIDLHNQTKSIAKIKKSKYSYKGNLALTKKVISKTLDKKTDEMQFIDALVNSIFNDIKNLQY